VINIISCAVDSTLTNGSVKVYRNLVKGLELIGYPYVVNRRLDATERLWIHDATTAIPYVDRQRVKTVLGPNMWVMPHDIPPECDFGGAVYVQPSQWKVDLWNLEGFDRCPLVVWPVGVDTGAFRPAETPASERRVLIYHKHRDIDELPPILDVLHERGLRYRLLLYGSYDETRFRRCLDEASFVIWHGTAETQGLALQEAFACDVPALVCAGFKLSETQGTYEFGAETDAVAVTPAPYFDARCGLMADGGDAIPAAIDEMVARRDEFRPREYVLENLTLEKQAREFVALWERWGLTFDEGLSEPCRSGRPFQFPLRRRAAFAAQGLARFRRKRWNELV